MLEVLKRKLIYWYYAKVLKKEHMLLDSIRVGVLKAALESARTNKEKTKTFLMACKQACEWEKEKKI